MQSSRKIMKIWNIIIQSKLKLENIMLKNKQKLKKYSFLD